MQPEGVVAFIYLWKRKNILASKKDTSLIAFGLSA